MRMWGVDVKILCNQHLLGEHAENHAFVGILNRGIDVAGYVENNLLEVTALHQRHDFLTAEMIFRGMSPNSPWVKLNDVAQKIISKYSDKKIDVVASWKDLMGRCNECHLRYEHLVMSRKIIPYMPPEKRKIPPQPVI